MVQDEEAVLRLERRPAVKSFADQDAIVQVLSNLIENGITYASPRKQDGAAW